MKEKKQIDMIDILKYGMVLVLLIYIVWLIMLQGSTNTPMKTMKKNILAVTDLKGMKQATNQDLKKYYGLNASDFQDVVLYMPDDVMGVNELLLIKLKNVQQSEQVEQVARERIDTQKTSFEGYGVEQTKLINVAVVENRGDYVLMVIHKDAEAVQKAFRKSL